MATSTAAAFPLAPAVFAKRHTQVVRRHLMLSRKASEGLDGRLPGAQVAATGPARRQGRHVARGTRGAQLRRWALGAGDSSSQSDGEAAPIPLASEPKQGGAWAWSVLAELGEVMRFSLPAVGIFLVNPLMTLVDTAFLGAGPAAEQAALNPSGALLDYPIILLSFLAVGTTSLVARDPESSQNARDVLRPALWLGFVLGVVLLIVTHLGTPHVLNALGVSPEVHAAAATYIGIRQLFCPLVLICSAAQSAYLASKDVYTPLKLVVVSGCINCIGDLLLVWKLGMGVAGAAWATVASQFYLAAGLLVGLRRMGKLPSLLPLPKLHDCEPFSEFAKSITLINVLKVAGFSSITYYASNHLSTEHLAAQQVLVSIFIFLSLISQPLLQCCQTFLPSLLPGGANPDANKAKSTLTAIFAASLSLGLSCGLLGTLMTSFGHHMFTVDPAVVGYMHGAVLSVLYCHLVSPIALSVDAVLVAAKDLDSLCWIQAVGLVTLLGFMSLATSWGMGLSAIWLAYGTHLLSRLALCWWRMRKIPGLA